MEHRIFNRDMSLTVSDLGAEAVSVICRGKERLWQNENGTWGGHAPLLFPVCGKCAVITDGVRAPLASHGFARRQVFSFLSQTEDTLQFALEPSDATRAVYPFDFRFEVTYTLSGMTVSVAYLITNTGNRRMYASCGAHDTFALDEGPGSCEVVFEKPEVFTHLCHDDDGMLTGETMSFGEGRVFPLPEDYLQMGRTVIFGGISSRAVTLRKKDGTPLADVTFEGFSNLLFWRPQGARMICIEPWYNLPDDAKTAAQPAEQKAGLFALLPGESRRFVRSITWHPVD